MPGAAIAVSNAEGLMRPRKSLRGTICDSEYLLIGGVTQHSEEKPRFANAKEHRRYPGWGRQGHVLLPREIRSDTHRWGCTSHVERIVGAEETSVTAITASQLFVAALRVA